MPDRVSSRFRKIVTETEAGDLIVPRLRTALYSPKLKPFNVDNFGGYDERAPDGYFHPSTHPLMTDRQLYYYLAQPEGLIPEAMDPSSTIAVTVGHFWHAFIESVLFDIGVISAKEVFVKDEATGSRGSMDGVGAWGVFEMKTCHPMKLPNLSAVTYADANPEYYAQAQEYMRMSGEREHRTVFIVPQYPFNMKEIKLPYDAMAANAIRDKYLRVRQYVADQQVPEACCAPMSKESKICEARAICPIGRI